MDGLPRGGAAVRALASQVKPPFMAPVVATALFGALLAPAVDPVVAAIHLSCAALALYVAHLRDEHVDAHLRGEEAPSVPRPLLRRAMPVASGGFLLSWVALWLVAGATAAALTLVPWLLGLLHAPYLDTNPVTVSLDYPVAVAFVVAGGYATQTGGLSGWVPWVAGVFAFVLAGATVSLDRTDRAFDRGIGKRTVAVALGDDAAAAVSAALVAAGGGILLAGTLAGPLPDAAAAAAVVPVATAVVSRRASPERAVRLQMVATYPFGGVLFVLTCLGVDCALARAVGL